MVEREEAFPRRKFVAVAGSAAMGLALFGCGQPAQDDEPTVEEDTAQEEPVAEEVGVPDPIEQRVDELASGLSDRQKLCQLFVVTPESLTGTGVAIQAGEATQQALEQCPVGGVVYFAQNLIDEAQTTEMLDNTFHYALSACGIPPLLCVDEEGGTVVRIGGKDGFTARNVGDMADIGAAGDAAAAKETAEYIGDYLLDLGFNTDFAPVCDVADNPNSDTMKQRSFGADPHLVAEMVEAQVEGFAEADMLCAAKHFPGIGAAVGDSHDSRITFDGVLGQLENTELVPFEAAIEAGVPLVMMGHLSLPAIVGDDTPACLSSVIATDILRGSMGFEGIAITDSLSMGAVGEYYTTAEAAVLALQAGCDMLLMPADLTEAIDAVEAALADGRLTWDRVEEALRRILRVKVRHFFG